MRPRVFDGVQAEWLGNTSTSKAVVGNLIKYLGIAIAARDADGFCYKQGVLGQRGFIMSMTEA